MGAKEPNLIHQVTNPSLEAPCKPEVVERGIDALAQFGECEQC